MPFCPNCGKQVEQDAAFCSACGNRLVQGQPQVPIYSPTYNGAFPDPEALTARTLILAAIIVQALFFFLFVFIFGFVFMFPFGPPGFPLFSFAAIFGIFFFIGIIWVVLDYFLVYSNLTTEEKFPSARTPALVLGIVQLLGGGVITGILLILAYVKIGDSLRSRGKALY